MKNKAKRKKIKSTQKNLYIAALRNNVVILKDGSLRAVINVNSVNFGLKSEDEQNALVSSYVTFLNYLDFPIQVVVQSRKLDIEGYIKRIEKAERGLTNDLLKRQIVNYKAYIQQLIEGGNIMTKSFFIAVPYSAVEDKKQGFLQRLNSVLTPAKVIRLKQKKFDEYSRELDQRLDNVKMNIASLGLNATRLDTQSLIELYYNVYNPVTSKSQKLQDLEKVRVEEY